MDGLKYQMMKNISVVFLSLYSILLIVGAYNRLNTFVKHKKKTELGLLGIMFFFFFI